MKTIFVMYFSCARHVAVGGGGDSSVEIHIMCNKGAYFKGRYKQYTYL